jgi:glycosyltransferase involved in cell wall biosynthesis
MMDKPFWSVMIPSFNCAQTLRRAIESALAGKRRDTAMQIEVVDDCSTRDRPEDVVEAYRDRGVTFYRQPKNVGVTANFNTCIARARGEWIHILHGDDYVHPDFYSALENGISSNPRVRVAFTSFVAVDEVGQAVWTTEMPAARGVVDHKWRDAIAIHNWIMAPAIVVNASAYAEVGGFSPSLFHTADWDMWRRLMWRYEAWFEPQVLAFYVVHSQSDTSRLMRTGANLRDAFAAVKIGEQYFPIDRRKELSGAARESIARFGLATAERFFAQRDIRAAAAQLRASIAIAPGLMLGRELPRRAYHRFKRRAARYLRDKRA